MTAHDIKDVFKGKKVAVTGGGGTIGQGLIDQLLDCDVELVRALEISEEALFRLEGKYAHNENFQYFLCDIREYANLERMLREMDFVFHTAAFKHVPLCERSPFTALGTNVYGMESLIRAALRLEKCRVLFTSSDKAVNPTNVMGTSKLMGERMITAANALVNNGHETVFTSTRFGNVAGSSGSVIPLFVRQISEGGPVTVTDREMTRFVMTIPEACLLVMRSLVLAKGGEVFVTKMPVVCIEDLAKVMIKMVAPFFNQDPSKIEIVEVGARPGEKLYEELLTEEEVRRTVEMENFFSVLPAFRNVYAEIDYNYQNIETTPATEVYNSGNHECMTDDQITDFLLRPGVLDEILRQWVLKEQPEGLAISAVV